MKKAYVSNRFPNLNIQDKVQFQDGVFETESAEAQAVVEQHEWFNIHIVPRDAPSEAETPVGEAPAEPASTEGESEGGFFRGRHGQRGSRSSG